MTDFSEIDDEGGHTGHDTHYRVAAPITKMHAHRRAQRYMEKRFLKDFWNEWKKVVDGGQAVLDTQPQNAAINNQLAQLKELHRQRQDLLLAKGNLIRQARAICRRLCARNSPQQEGEKFDAYMKRIVKAADDLYDDMDEVATISTAQHLASAANFEEAIKPIEKRMIGIVRELPIHPWAKSVHGLGDISVAVLLGETGNPSNYANPGKLWRRMGLAPFGGKAPSTWRRFGGLKAEQWEDVGYSPKRRSMMFVIGDCLIKGKSKYRQVYLDRKEYEMQKGGHAPVDILFVDAA